MIDRMERNPITQSQLKLPSRFADHEMRRLLTQAAMQIFDDWQLTNSERLKLLGYSPRAHGVIRRYRRGAVIQKNSDAVIRMRLLIPIHLRLKELLGHHSSARQYWLRTPHDQLEERTPLATLADSNPARMLRVLELVRAGRY